MWNIRRRSLIKYLFGIIGLFLFIFGAMSDYAAENVIALYILALSLFLVWWVRQNYFLLIVFAVLLYCNYSVVFSEYCNVISGTMFTRYAHSTASAEAIYIMLLFWSVVTIAMPDSCKKLKHEDLKEEFWNYNSLSTVEIVFVMALSVLLVLIWAIAYTRPTELGDRGQPSALYEYSIIFIIIGYYFGRKSKLCTTVLSVILFAYALQNFIFGGRITGLQLLIVFYLMVLSEHFSLKTIVPFAIVLFLVFNIIGTFRGSWLSGGFSLDEVIASIKKNMFTLDTAYSSYHTSMTFLLTEDKVSMADRLDVFLGFVKSIFTGGYGTESNSVAHFTAQYYSHYNGGYLPFFFKFYFGWIGVPVIALLLAKIFRLCAKIETGSSGLVKCVLM